MVGEMCVNIQCRRTENWRTSSTHLFGQLQPHDFTYVLESFNISAGLFTCLSPPTQPIHAQSEGVERKAGNHCSVSRRYYLRASMKGLDSGAIDLQRFVANILCFLKTVQFQVAGS
jgi:hypothetical protein